MHQIGTNPRHICKFQNMCSKAVGRILYEMDFSVMIIDRKKNCKRPVQIQSSIANQYKSQSMCEKAVERVQFAFRFLPDLFITPNTFFGEDDDFIKWYDGYIQHTHTHTHTHSHTHTHTYTHTHTHTHKKTKI